MTSLFKKKKKPIVEAAEAIVAETDFRILKAAWGEYFHLKKNDDAYEDDDKGEYSSCAPEWFGLKRIVESAGRLENINIFDIHQINALINHGYYDEIMHILMDHHSDEEEASRLFTAHPGLHKAIPDEYDNTRQVMEVLAEVVRKYRWEIDNFADSFGAEIESGIKKIIKNAA